jgi:hypothetical protein
VLLHHVAVPIHHKKRGQCRHAAIFRNDRAVGHHNRVIDSGLFGKLLYVRRIAVIHRHAYNLQTILVTIRQINQHGNFSAAWRAPSGPEIYEYNFAFPGCGRYRVAIKIGHQKRRHRLRMACKSYDVTLRRSRCGFCFARGQYV